MNNNIDTVELNRELKKLTAEKKDIDNKISLLVSKLESYHAKNMNLDDSEIDENETLQFERNRALLLSLDTFNKSLQRRIDQINITIFNASNESLFPTM